MTATLAILVVVLAVNVLLVRRELREERQGRQRAQTRVRALVESQSRLERLPPEARPYRVPAGSASDDRFGWGPFAVERLLGGGWVARTRSGHRSRFGATPIEALEDLLDSDDRRPS